MLRTEPIIIISVLTKLLYKANTTIYFFRFPPLVDVPGSESGVAMAKGVLGAEASV